MNPKIKKLRAEREKLQTRISSLQERDKDLEKQIRDLENMDIVGLVRAKGYTLEQFSALIRSLQHNPIPNNEQEVLHDAAQEAPLTAAD